MAINTAAIGVRSDPARTTWTSDDSILYALAVGAGGIDPAGHELAFTTDDSAGVAQRVLPTFGMVLAGTDARVWSALGDIDLNALVHAGQEFVAHREIPPEGEIEVVGWIDAVWDKGKAALAEYKSEARLIDDREPLFTLTGTVLIMGAGGFGGERGPSAAATALPERPPDLEVTYHTRPEQALLYRLTGDRARHNSDPAAAAEAGFQRPILHGLCTYGFAGRALLHSICGSDPARFGLMSCRFTSPVFPGDDLITRIWDLGDRWAFGVAAADGRLVLDGGQFALRDGMQR
jgi:acyl dehydratase